MAESQRGTEAFSHPQIHSRTGVSHSMQFGNFLPPCWGLTVLICNSAIGLVNAGVPFRVTVCRTRSSPKSACRDPAQPPSEKSEPAPGVAGARLASCLRLSLLPCLASCLLPVTQEKSPGGRWAPVSWAPVLGQGVAGQGTDGRGQRGARRQPWLAGRCLSAPKAPGAPQRPRSGEGSHHTAPYAPLPTCVRHT
jgi:hypothetical protein